MAIDTARPQAAAAEPHQKIAKQAAASASTVSTEVNQIEDLVVNAMEAFEQDKDPMHLLQAMQALQSMLEHMASIQEMQGELQMQMIQNSRGAARTQAPTLRPLALPLAQRSKSPEDIGRASRQIRQQMRASASHIRHAMGRAQRSLEQIAAQPALAAGGPRPDPRLSPPGPGRRSHP